MDKILEKLKNKQNLTFEESKSAFEILMTGKASDEQIFNFLTLLSEKGEVERWKGGMDKEKFVSEMKENFKGFRKQVKEYKNDKT